MIVLSDESKKLQRSVMDFKRDNVRDHRAGTSDHPFQNHAQVRLRVHHIVIRRCEAFFLLPFVKNLIVSTSDFAFLGVPSL